MNVQLQPACRGPHRRVQLEQHITQIFNRSSALTTLDAHNSADRRCRLKRGEADIGFASLTRDADLQFVPLFRDQLGLLARSDHPLLQLQRDLVWGDLAGYDFLGVSAGTATKPILEGIPNLPVSVNAPRYALSSTEALEAMLLAGHGIAALPALHGARDTGRPLRF